MEHELITKLEKLCPICGASLLPRVVREQIGDASVDRELTENMKEFEYNRLFFMMHKEKIIVCSKCSWAQSV